MKPWCAIERRPNKDVPLPSPPWPPCTKMAKEMARADGSRQNLARAATKDALETTHMKMLKWVLGLHKKANNNFCYGDTGRLPWALSVLPQCLRYFDRLSQTSPDVSSVNFLVHQTFQEQKNLNLSWYETWNSIAQSESKAAKHAPTNPATNPRNTVLKFISPLL